MLHAALPGRPSGLHKRMLAGYDVLCRLSRDILAHGAACAEELLPSPSGRQRPMFQASDVEVCGLLPGLLNCSETHFIEEMVTLLTNLKHSGASPAPNDFNPALNDEGEEEDDDEDQDDVDDDISSSSSSRLLPRLLRCCKALLTAKMKTMLTNLKHSWTSSALDGFSSSSASRNNAVARGTTLLFAGRIGQRRHITRGEVASALLSAPPSSLARPSRHIPQRVAWFKARCAGCPRGREAARLVTRTYMRALHTGKLCPCPF